MMGNWNQSYGATPSGQEPVFFQDERGVYVSRSRVVLGGVTFPINGITAVYSRKITKSPLGLILGILLALASATCVLTGAASLASSGKGAAENNVGVGCAGMGGLEFLIGVALVVIYIWVQKDRYALVVGTAGREVNAIVHADWRYIGSVVEAINNALASRM